MDQRWSKGVNRLIGVRGPFHEQFFHRNSNSIEILFCCYQSYNKVIAMKLCIWHDSCAVVAACANLFSVIRLNYTNSSISIFPRIFLTAEKNSSWNGPRFQLPWLPCSPVMSCIDLDRLKEIVVCPTQSAWCQVLNSFFMMLSSKYSIVSNFS